MPEVEFRFYEELNDFLPERRRKGSFVHRFDGTPSVKDVIESLGVPHAEVDLVLVDGQSVGFDRRLSGGERIAVYPVFERLDISGLTRLRPEPLRESRFIADVHLGRLARYLRLLGFDTSYRNDLDDEEIATRARSERRIVLTRDRGLLKRKTVTRGHWVRATNAGEQLHEVVRAFDLAKSVDPFTRCLVCNGRLQFVAKREVAELLPEETREHFDTFLRCVDCARLFWPGAHYSRLSALVESVKERAPDAYP
ncbi:MAG TPA: Mut7-C RNAse domain-containing protein [Vicinamibacteria bacterium]|nr:Mut7-C RNAse domain-containing protein [Vicinamibacteria bacterium]